MNFTKAAKELMITQPAVSQHIHFLEDFYEVKLFYHVGKQIHLTEKGNILLQAVTTIKNDVNQLKNQLKQVSNDTPNLKFGVTRTISEAIISKKLVTYIKKYENPSIQMIVGTTKELLKLIDDGIIDFALVEGYFPKNEYDYRILSKEAFVAVSSPSHIFSIPPTKIGDLLHETIITREKGSSSREILQQYLDMKGFSLSDFSCNMEIGALDIIKRLAIEDCGIAFLYETAVEEELSSNQLIKIPLTDFDLTYDFSFIWNKNSIYSYRYEHIYNELQQSSSASNKEAY